MRLQQVPRLAVDIQLEGVAEEVIRPGVFIQAADEIAYCVDELLLATGRRIQEQVVYELVQGATLMICHALQHLKLQAVEDPAVDREHDGVGGFKEIVRGNAEVNSRDVFLGHPEVQHGLVVTIRLQLGLEWSLGPSRNGGLQPLAFHVGTLDQANDDRRAAFFHPFARPCGDRLLDAQAVGDVGLERDACADGFQAGPAEGGHESFRRDVQVTVFLHVEVDELRHLCPVMAGEGEICCCSVKAFQSIGEDLDRMVPAQQVNLRINRRNLHRDHLDIRLL